MNGADFRDIDDELWNDIQEIFSDQDNHQSLNSYSLEFVVQIASGFRFRYQSEIEKKSYSSIKGLKKQQPVIKVISSSDIILQLDLVTEGSTDDNIFPHFYSLYEVSKLPKFNVTYHEGVCFINISQGVTDIRLDFIGIRKVKLKEAIPKIMELYPNKTESEAKKFFNENKETVKFRALLIDAKYILSSILSGVIRSQTTKENKEIKIQHISPKTVADTSEKIIIVLEKKITSDCTTYLIFENVSPQMLNSTYDDGQTFVFNIPPIHNLINAVTGKIKIECSDSFDEKPVRFVPLISEARKRKSPHCEGDVPLKRPTNYDNPRQLYPESGNVDVTLEIDGPSAMDSEEVVDEIKTANNIEYDGPHDKSCEHDTNDLVVLSPQMHISGNDSCKDSGIHSDNKSSVSSDYDSDDDSFDGTEDESDDIEIEGIRRRQNNPAQNLDPITFPPTKRTIDSQLVTDKQDQVSNKIFSEIARIGHDFAFGKKPSDLFERIEKQLPVVFTLQDDVGDTPLNNAILKGNTQQAERILKIVVNECNWALNLVNTSGHTALILAPACDVPCSFITKLLDAGCRLDMYDDLGKSAMTYAIEYKNTKALEVLLKYIKDRNMVSLLKRMDKVYFSLLQIAVMNSYVEGVNMLLAMKDRNGNYMVDVNELALMNKETALHIAVERDVGLDIVKLLLKRSDIKINHKKNNNFTALLQAKKMKAHEVMLLLKNHGAVDVSSTEETQDSDEEMEDEDVVVREECAVVEMTPENGGRASCTIVNLTANMESMSLKGTEKSQLINLLVNGEVFLTVHELNQIIRPSFKALLSKYNDTYKKEIVDILERFNCLPNSLGQLFDKLREIDRMDIIKKVANHFSKRR